MTTTNGSMTAQKKYEHDSLTEKIIGMCYKIHKELGPGFPEKIYHRALIILLLKDGMITESEKEFEVYFQSKKVGKFRCDLVIEKKVIVEMKSVVGFMPKVFMYQTLAYLKASKIKTGLLINFGNKSCEVNRYSM